MERPSFVDLALTCFLLDIVFTVSLLFIGEMAFLYLFLLVPAVAARGILGHLKWAKGRTREKSYLGGLAMLLCASSLIFLISVVGITSVKLPAHAGLWLILAYIYFQIWVLRFYLAGMVTMGVAPICLLLAPGRFSKLNAALAGLTSWCGVYMIQHFGESTKSADLVAVANRFVNSSQGEPDPVLTLILVLLFTASFGFAVMHGALLQWAVAARKQ